MNKNPADVTILANLIADRMMTWPDLDVLTFVSINPDGSYKNEIRTYEQLWQNGQRVAAALDSEGMRVGESFGLVTQNHPEFVDVMVGSSIAGTVFVPIDPRTKGDKLAYMLEHAGCRGAVIGDYALGQLIDVIDKCPSLEWVWIVIEPDTHAPKTRLRQRNFDQVLSADYAEMTIRVSDPDVPMQMLYTSGTTGDPKAILSPYSRFGMIAGLGEALGLRTDDRTYTGLSLTHANAQLITLGATLHMGLRGVFSRKFTKSRLWDITRAYGCTTFNLLGGMTTAIYSEPAKPDDADNPVRFVLSAGMPAAIWDHFEKRFNLKVYEFYGAAEGGITMNPPGTGPVGSIGKPPPTMEARIVDEHDNECPPNVQGEMVFRYADGSCPAVSYFNNQEASAKKTRDGWLRMGDICHMDADGWFYFDYRMGGGIRHNGDFVNPAFVEKAIAEHDAVNDVFVYGVTSANGVPGEKDVVAVVVAVPGDEIDPKALFAHCREALESNFVPSYIQVMDEIPKTASEKPQERFCLEYFEHHPEAVFTEQGG